MYGVKTRAFRQTNAFRVNFEKTILHKLHRVEATQAYELGIIFRRKATDHKIITCAHQQDLYTDFSFIKALMRRQ